MKPLRIPSANCLTYPQPWLESADNFIDKDLFSSYVNTEKHSKQATSISTVGEAGGTTKESEKNWLCWAGWCVLGDGPLACELKHSHPHWLAKMFCLMQCWQGWFCVLISHSK